VHATSSLMQAEMRSWVDELHSGGQQWMPIVDPGIPIQVV
jgi:hypothetical protein